MSMDGFYKEIKGKKFKDYDPEIIAWERENLEDLLTYKFPKLSDNIKNKKYFAVKDYEKAIFYNKGELIGILKGGVYELDKKAKIKGTEIVWLDTSFIDIPWGIPQSEGIPTKDGDIIGLHGDLKLRIRDVKTLYNDVIAGKEDWRTQDLKNFIMSLLHTSLRDIFKTYNAKSIILEDRERVINLTTSKITEEFLRYGLELETFNVIGIKAAGGAEKLFKEDKERIEYITKHKKDLQNRVEDLKNKLNEQQDLLLNDKITQEEYDKKKEQIHRFIDEAEDDLKTLE
ncbi:MAG: SPFH domain-containing protein [Candidatus Lokiarchaeota archaeon]|nr:SPFH domain-containing protein [Candidatus Lokiarchaeota archaeon]